MSEKPRLRYEKPVSIDMGRVAPILGDRCSVGSGAADCSIGFNNTSVPACKIGGGATLTCEAGNGAGTTCYTGSTANDTCQNGDGARTFCYPVGGAAGMGCFAGSST